MMMRFRIPAPGQLTPFCGSSSERLATWPDGSIAEYVTAEGTEKRPFKKKVIDMTKSRKRKGQHSPWLSPPLPKLYNTELPKKKNGGQRARLFLRLNPTIKGKKAKIIENTITESDKSLLLRRGK